MSYGSPEASVEAAERVASHERSAEIDDLRVVLGTAEGRNTLWRILEQCGIYRPVFDPIDEGKRRVGLWVLEEVFTADEEAYTLLRSEAVARRKKHEQLMTVTIKQVEEDGSDG